MRTGKLVFDDGLESKYLPFWKRVVTNTLWIITLVCFALAFLFFKDGINSLFVSIPFLLFVLVYLTIYEYRKDYILVTYLELDYDKAKAYLRVNKMDATFIDGEYDLDDLRFQVKRVFSGRGGNPNFWLDVFFKNELLVKQRSNLIWSNERIEKMREDLPD